MSAGEEGPEHDADQLRAEILALRGRLEFVEQRLLHAHRQDALGTLVGGIAHEFNNILASFAANLWLLREALPGEHPATESLAALERSSVRARRLVEQLTALKAEQPQQLSPVSLGDVVVEATRQLRPMIAAGAELLVDVEPGPAMVLADAAQLHQVVVNLCTNAWFAVQDGKPAAPRIVVRVRVRELNREALARASSGLKPGVFAELTVLDNGIGMDTPTQERIFEPFVTTRRVGRGVGLGLSVVKGLVHAHGGVVEVTSAPGRGSTFTALFPSLSVVHRATPAMGIARRLSSRPPRARRHILCVDDDDSLLRVVTRLLERAGHRVSARAGADEARQLLRERPSEYDVLLVDLGAPDLWGLEFARSAIELCPELPVVLMSGYAAADVRNEAASAGVTRFLDKADLAAELKTMLAEFFPDDVSR